jgi:excinuclease ABC subunit B
LYSLLRFGIVAFVKKKTNFTSNINYREAYWEITISGKFVKTFQKEIGFTQKPKNNDLEKTIAKFANIDKDIIPANALIKKIRKRLDVSQKNLSTLAQITQPYISLIENGKIMPSREATTRITAAFNFLAKQKHIVVQSEISKLSSLLNLFWSPISIISHVNGEEYVYDFSVESNETFLAGTGGIFVHNTFVMANLINRLQKPTLILAHNKTLAAQLYAELKELFPQNRVEYFISFYDYYQPESYLPTTDMYIEKDSSVNEQIEKMRMHAVSSVVSRNDTIIVASISCIYSLGNPEDYKTMAIDLTIDEPLPRQKLINALVDMQYERNDMVLEAGRFRVRGETIDIVPAYEKDILRVELEAGKIKKIKEVDAVTGDTKTTIDKVTLYPARQYVVPEEKMKRAFVSIEAELEARLQELPPLEAQRLKQRTNYDLEMMKEMGFCAGIENYSRHFDGRKPGEPPFTLMDYFPKDYLLIIDESHQTIPQSRAMYNGEFSRKKNLIEFGFRLPSAYDNRPLKFEEFEKKMGRTLFVSATPADYETEKSGAPVELITRPTGLLDPIVELHPIKGQMQHLMEEAKKTISNGDRILITTLTKRMAEDLTEYLVKEGFRVRYMHSEIDSLDRIELVRQLRVGDYDILVGINLLREGLDIPEVSTIFILDADKEGFLRDERSLIQTIGRAARNVNGRVVLYADIITRSIKRAMEITQYRRNFQIRFNKVHNITPKTIVKSVSQKESTIKGIKHLAKADVQRQIIELDAQMREAAEKLDFEKAIQLRDTIQELNKSLAQKAKTQQSQ